MVREDSSKGQGKERRDESREDRGKNKGESEDWREEGREGKVERGKNIWK